MHDRRWGRGVMRAQAVRAALRTATRRSRAAGLGLRVEDLEGRSLLSAPGGGAMPGPAVPAQVAAAGMISTRSVLASGTTLRGVEGQPTSGVVASFADLDPRDTAADFSATIDWGDGTTSAGTVAPDGHGGFDVAGSETYAHQGTYTIHVAISGPARSAGGVTTSTSTGTAVILDAASARPGSPAGTSTGGGPGITTPGQPRPQSSGHPIPKPQGSGHGVQVPGAKTLLSAQQRFMNRLNRQLLAIEHRLPIWRWLKVWNRHQQQVGQSSNALTAGITQPIQAAWSSWLHALGWRPHRISRFKL